MACTSWPRSMKTRSQRRVWEPSKSPRTARRRGCPGDGLATSSGLSCCPRGAPGGGGAAGRGGGRPARAEPRDDPTEGVDVQGLVSKTRYQRLGDRPARQASVGQRCQEQVRDVGERRGKRGPVDPEEGDEGEVGREREHETRDGDPGA